MQEHPWVTKGGSDPLLSAEENCSDLVGIPTEAELEHAITGNMKQLLVVVRHSFLSLQVDVKTRRS